MSFLKQFVFSTDDIKPKNEKYDLHVFLNFNTFDVVVADPWSIFCCNFFIEPQMQMIFDRKSAKIIMGKNKNDYTKLEWVELKQNCIPYEYSIKKIEEYLSFY